MIIRKTTAPAVSLRALPGAATSAVTWWLRTQCAAAPMLQVLAATGNPLLVAVVGNTHGRIPHKHVVALPKQPAR